jgi:hypothetical protein
MHHADSKSRLLVDVWMPYVDRSGAGEKNGKNGKNGRSQKYNGRSSKKSGSKNNKDDTPTQTTTQCKVTFSSEEAAEAASYFFFHPTVSFGWLHRPACSLLPVCRSVWSMRAGTATWRTLSGPVHAGRSDSHPASPAGR